MLEKDTGRMRTTMRPQQTRISYVFMHIVSCTILSFDSSDGPPLAGVVSLHVRYAAKNRLVELVRRGLVAQEVAEVTSHVILRQLLKLLL